MDRLFKLVTAISVVILVLAALTILLILSILFALLVLTLLVHRILLILAIMLVLIQYSHSLTRCCDARHRIYSIRKKSNNLRQNYTFSLHTKI